MVFSAVLSYHGIMKTECSQIIVILLFIYSEIDIMYSNCKKFEFLKLDQFTVITIAS